MDGATEPRPLGELFADLARETGVLLRKEVALARVEMKQKVAGAARDLAWLGLGVVLAMLGLAALAAAAVLALSLILPTWGAALIVGVGLSLIGGSLALSGLRALRAIDPVPRVTVQTLKEDQRWLEEQKSR